MKTAERVSGSTGRNHRSAPALGIAFDNFRLNSGLAWWVHESSCHLWRFGGGRRKINKNMRGWVVKNNSGWSRFRLSGLAIVGLVYSLQAAAVGYTITDLGALPGGSVSRAYGLNNSEQVVGWSTKGGDAGSYAFLYSNDSMTSLGTYGAGTKINDSGQIVGWTDSGYGSTTSRAFLYSGGTLIDLNASGSSIALSINNAGQVVGWENNSSTPIPFLYSEGVITTLGWSGIASDINNTGQVAGWAFNGVNRHAILYSGGNIIDLGVSGASESFASAINDAGQVVGDSGSRAFLYDNGIMKDIGWLGTANDINNMGQVVGQWWEQRIRYRAVLYNNETVTDLNDLIPSNSGWELISATGINDYGQITGFGNINSTQHAFLMTPTSVVPVPAAFWLFGSGLIGLFGFMRRGRAKN